MTRYFLRRPTHGLVGIAIVVKGAMIMFAERQYWHDVADRFVKENVTGMKPNRGNILILGWQTDGKFADRNIKYIWTSCPAKGTRSAAKRTSSARILSGKPISIPSVSGFIRFSGHQCRHLQKPSAQGAGDEEPELQHSSQPQPAHLLHSV